MKPLFFHHLTVDPDELAVLCHASELVQVDTAREGYGYAVREKSTGAFFIHESLSGAVYRCFERPE